MISVAPRRALELADLADGRRRPLREPARTTSRAAQSVDLPAPLTAVADVGADVLDLRVQRRELRLQRRRGRARRRRARARSSAHAHEHHQHRRRIDCRSSLSTTTPLQTTSATTDAIVPAVAARPCVCRRELGHCDSSCSRDLLETTFFPTFMNVRDRTVPRHRRGPDRAREDRGPARERRPRRRRRARGRARGRRARRRGIARLAPAHATSRAISRARCSCSRRPRTPTSTCASSARPSARAMLVNVVDVPPLCNFIMPAIVRNGAVSIAISTSGASPALAKRLKREIAERVRRAVRAPGRAAERHPRPGRRTRSRPTRSARSSSRRSSTAIPTRSSCCAGGDERAVRELIAERQRDAASLAGLSLRARDRGARRSSSRCAALDFGSVLPPAGRRAPRARPARRRRDRGARTSSATSSSAPRERAGRARRRGDGLRRRPLLGHRVHGRAHAARVGRALRADEPPARGLQGDVRERSSTGCSATLGRRAARAALEHRAGPSRTRRARRSATARPTMPERRAGGEVLARAARRRAAARGRARRAHRGAGARASWASTRCPRCGIRRRAARRSSAPGGRGARRPLGLRGELAAARRRPGASVGARAVADRLAQREAAEASARARGSRAARSRP